MRKISFYREVYWIRYVQLEISAILLMKYWICNESVTEIDAQSKQYVCGGRGGGVENREGADHITIRASTLLDLVQSSVSAKDSRVSA